MKTYPELVAEGMKRALYEADEYEYLVRYLKGSIFVYIQLEYASKGIVESEVFQVKSAADASKAYQSFWKKHSGSYPDSGIFAGVGFAQNASDAKDFIEEMIDMNSIEYNEMRSVCFGLETDNESSNSVKSKSDSYFKQLDPLFKAFTEIQKAGSSKNIKQIEKVWTNVEKFEEKARSPISDIIEFFGQADQEEFEVKSKQPIKNDSIVGTLVGLA